MCASTLPVLAIVILYFVQSMGRRLAAIAVFTSLFSAAVGVCSTSRGIEIFAATAGFVSRLLAISTNMQIIRFAAVQVVFIGTTSSKNSGT
jgi:hypothetical protein